MALLTSLSLLTVTVVFSAVVFIFFTWTELGSLDIEQESALDLLAEQIEDAGKLPLESPEYYKLKKPLERRNAEFQVYSTGYQHKGTLVSGENAVKKLSPELVEILVGRTTAKSVTIDPERSEIIPESFWLLPLFPPTDGTFFRARWTPFEIEGRKHYLVALHPLDALPSSRSSLLKMILSTLGITALLSVAMGFFVAQSAIKPFTRIKKAICRVSIENMQLDVSLQDADSEIRDMVVLINEMLENLGKSIRQLQQFTADASHELRTPLAVMKGITEVALLKDREPRYYVLKLQELASHIENMQSLVGALLELARLDTFSRLDGKDPVELLIVADEAVSVTEPAILQRGQSLKKDLSPAPTFGREALLLRLVTNLLDNASKYSPEDGTIAIRTFCNRKIRESVLEVADTGKGMTPEEIDRCFDRFWRADHSRATAGYGLGLSLVLRIAELHEGIVEIESEPGKGTLFRIRFTLDEKSLANYEEE